MNVISHTWRVLISVYFWGEMFFSAMILFPVSVCIWLVTLPFDKRLFLLNRFSIFWTNLVLTLNPLWKITVSGMEHVDPGSTYVIVANHQSGVDILVLSSLKLHFKWVSKRSLFFFPFIGWNMAMNRHIPLERKKKSSMHRMILRSEKALREGNSLMIFPEGTRSPDGNLQPFKTGAFKIALDTRTPVLPVIIRGTRKAMQKGGLLVYRNHDIKVNILAPIPVESFEKLTPKELAKETNEIIGRFGDLTI
jgi:1-acyl-sn-glycerol-3-phosphate acyltransferase